MLNEILIVTFILLVIGLIVYTVIKLRLDLNKYKQNLTTGSALPGDPGDPGNHGKHAYEIYNELNGTTLTEAAFNDLFIGTHGDDGIHAPIAMNGEHGEDGSTGFHGDQGYQGPEGLIGSPGLQGVHGETFINYFLQDETPPFTPPSDVKNYAVIIHNQKRIEYYNETGNLLTVTIAESPSVPPTTNVYISLIVYKNSKVLGIAGPLTINSVGPNNDYQFTNLLQSGISFRAVISSTKSFSMSSFTKNIFETSLEPHNFTNPAYNFDDPLIKKFYELATTNEQSPGKLGRIDITEIISTSNTTFTLNTL